MRPPIKKLTEIAEINPPRPAIEREDDTPTSFVPMAVVDDLKGELLRLHSKSYAKVKKGYTFFVDGDVIFAKITPCMQNGKHAIVRGLSDSLGFGSTEFHVIRVSDQVIPEWVHYFLRRKETLDAAAKTFTGTVGQQRVPASFLATLELPVPSVARQRQITARLKAQLTEVEKAREATEAQLDDATLLVTRHRKNSIDNVRSVPRAPLGDLILRIESGKSFKTTEMPARPDELGVLKVSAVSWNKFQPQEAKSIKGGYQPNERHRIKKGDLIISRANTLDLVGAVVRVPEEYPLRLLSDKTLRLVVNTNKVLSDYLLTVLRWPEARAHIEKNATGTSDSMRNISQKTINAVPVPLLSKDQQLKVIRQSSAVNTQLVQIQDCAKQALADLDFLPRAILTLAFEM